MPDGPERPPIPDALRGNRAPKSAPRVDIFNDPFNPPPPTDKPKAEEERIAEEEEKQPSGLAEMDAPHAFASVLGTGIGRAAMIVIICMLSFGVTLACHRVSLIFDGWRSGGFGGFFGAIFAVPGALFSSPGAWFSSLGDGITQPLGAPYLLLFVSGLILAVRSEIHIVKLMLFYAIASGIHAAAYLKMRNPFSLILWIAAMAGLVWLYRWYWKQQIQVEDPPQTDEE